MTREEFYRTVGVLLGCEVEPTEHLPYRRRWGSRAPGNGRYPCHGIVRWYSESCVQAALVDPPVTGGFTAESAIRAIEAATKN